ncbi:ATP-binding protein [Gimesia sp.]|uniref:ATP-binding protein n=1 Tax=Gimesia sp. TaxID=2024833 RepID=UPI003A8F1ADA
MTDTARISAHMLREGRRNIAETICSHLESSSSLNKEIAPVTRLEQSETHIHILAACIEFQSPVLLNDYVQWVTRLPESVSPYFCEISHFLDELVCIVEAEFPQEVAGVVQHYIDTARDSLLAESRVEPSVHASLPQAQLQRNYLVALLDTRRNDALNMVLKSIEAGVEIESIYLDVIQPAQHELGRLWQTGQISVAQEHYCTAATQFVMSQLQPWFLTTTSANQTLVATCVGDELHEVGLRIVADLFEVNGWNTIYLGANVPPESIAETLASSGSQILAISCTMTQHLFALADVIDIVRSHPGCEQVKILAGGYPFNIDPYLWKRVGADANALDGKAAIRVANRLIQSRSQAESQSASPATPQLDARVPTGLHQSDDDLSRLNNSLITLQRKLNKANVELAALNKANEEKAQALQLADRRKDEFLAMLAHELRGPLAPMELAVGLLQMDDLSPALIRESRETMQRQLHQMKHLINDLLDASRIAHGKIELKKEILDLADVLNRAIETVNPFIREKQQDLKLELPDTPIFLEGDEIRLTQVFANLLTNASKYTDNKGTIWLNTKQDRDAAVIEVCDNGFGIDPELLQDVFTTFTQEQRSKLHSKGGLGLGLSLVKQLVELHQGSVSADSEGADRGSVFSVRLPALEPEENYTFAESDSMALSSQNIPSRRVLIIEDTAGIARMISLLFEKLGHEPQVAPNGATAIRMFQETTPEIVVLDLMLPDMSGLEVAQELRRLDQKNSTLIVALTGHSDDQHRNQAREHGCDEYFVKPIDMQVLQELATHPKLMTINGSSGTK